MEMKAETLEAYVERVYGYAVKRTFTREEADELSQEILFTAVRELPKLRDDSRFEPWLWGLAARVAMSFRRRMGKQRAMFSYDDIGELPEREEDDGGEIYELLRSKIAMLSATFRDIIILHYYDGLSTKEISARLGVPEGTITWRLSEARRKLKRECEKMEESALRPVKLKLNICGTGNFGWNVPFPHEYINDALSQNILYNCYEEPAGVEELAKLSGVPAYYIEDCVDRLIKRDALLRTPNGKYQTAFAIMTDKLGVYCDKNARAAVEPIAERMLAALKKLAEELGGCEFYRAGKSESELTYLYGVMAFEYLRRRYCRLPCPEITEKYDGSRWEYIGYMESGDYHRTRIGRCCSNNLGSRGSYAHIVYTFAGFRYREMMWDVWINVCEDILTSGGTDDSDPAANAIAGGYIERRDDGLFVTIPAFTREQKAFFDAAADRCFSPLMDEYSALVERFVSGYIKLFPKRLADCAARFGSQYFFELFEQLALIWQENGSLGRPEPGSVCDVLIQHE